jgi:DNA-binding NarL/FixJ family response regulator
MKRIAVLLVEDHTIVREGLRVLIEAFGDIEIVGEAKTGREAVQMAMIFVRKSLSWILPCHH